MANPNPARISAPLWWFIEQCTALTSTAFASEYGGSYTDKPGSHNTRDNLIRQGRGNDYSIRDALNKQGPGDKTAAFDWTFPSAQGGNYTAIVLFSARIKIAWETRDPRTYVLQEVLCESDFDYDPEGYVFYPYHGTRVPDRTHKWHMHFGFIRKFLNDWAAFDALLSIIKGESLQAWRLRTGQVKPVPTPAPTPAVRGGDFDMYMVQVKGNDTVYQSDGWTYQGISFERFKFYVDVLKLGFVMVDSADKLPGMAGEPHRSNTEIATLAGVAQKILEKVQVAAEAATPVGMPGQLTADELRTLLAEDNMLQAKAVADEVGNRLNN